MALLDELLGEYATVRFPLSLPTGEYRQVYRGRLAKEGDAYVLLSDLGHPQITILENIGMSLELSIDSLIVADTRLTCQKLQPQKPALLID
jgi:hypothetical protein